MRACVRACVRAWDAHGGMGRPPLPPHPLIPMHARNTDAEARDDEERRLTPCHDAHQLPPAGAEGCGSERGVLAAVLLSGLQDRTHRQAQQLAHISVHMVTHGVCQSPAGYKQASSPCCTAAFGGGSDWTWRACMHAR